MSRLHNTLRLASLLLFGPGFVLFVAAALLVAPVGALQLNWQRGTQAEINEERTELSGSEHSRNTWNQVSRSAGRKNLPNLCTARHRIRTAVAAAYCRSSSELHGAVPPVDGWHSPLRC